MSEKSHIPPGPWCESVHPDAAVATDIISETTGEDICTVWFPHESAVSNLIAAAPSLLSALREMAAHARIGIINQPALNRAMAAIAEAEGKQ